MKRNINFTKARAPFITISAILIIIGLWYYLVPKQMNFGNTSIYLVEDYTTENKSQKAGFINQTEYQAEDKKGNTVTKKKILINLGIFAPHGFNLGIDFQGGLVHQLTVYSGIDIEDMRAYTEKVGLGSDVQRVDFNEDNRIGKADSFIIKTYMQEEDQQRIRENPDLTPAKIFEEKITALYALINKKREESLSADSQDLSSQYYILTGEELIRANKAYPDEITGEVKNLKTDDRRVVQNVVRESSNIISPQYSKGLRVKALLLILFVLLIMLVYISFRFKFKSALGAVMALVHDVLIILGFISIFKFEFNYTIIAAILTIIGYSLNDTIVIYDRIRENYGIMKDSSPTLIINTSINQSLSRTIITSVTTLLAVIALAVWGGIRIQDFAIILIVGIISGTYSSIFIASPIVDLWDYIFTPAKKREKIYSKPIETKKDEINKDDKSNIETTQSTSTDSVNLSKKQLKKISNSKKKK